MLAAGWRLRPRNGGLMDAFPISSNLLGKSASAYEHVRRAIVGGQLRPGRRLSATGLAAHFRISETPVREALVRLSAEGFLAWEASKGHFTKQVTVSEQVDLHELVAIGLQLCLQGLEPARRDGLAAVELRVRGELLESVEAPEAAENTAHLMTEVGIALVQSHGNAALAAMMSTVLDRTHLVRRLALDTPERVGLVRLRLEGLTSAVLAADAATAAAIVGQHLAERRRRLPELVQAANALAAKATYP